MSKFSQEYLDKLKEDLEYYSDLRKFFIAESKEALIMKTQHDSQTVYRILSIKFDEKYTNEISKLKIEIEFLTDYIN